MRCRGKQRQLWCDGARGRRRTNRGDGERRGQRADRGDGSLGSWTRSGRAQTAPALQPVLEQRKRGGRSRPSRAHARPRSGCCSPALELHARGWGRAAAGAEAGRGRSGSCSRATLELSAGAERRRQRRPAAGARGRPAVGARRAGTGPSGGRSGSRPRSVREERAGTVQCGGGSGGRQQSAGAERRRRRRSAGAEPPRIDGIGCLRFSLGACDLGLGGLTCGPMPWSHLSGRRMDGSLP